MVLKDIIGQEVAKKAFVDILRKKRLAHAYLLFGPRGVGKALFAMEAARSLLCVQGRGGSCGACPSCRQADRGNHADLTVFSPEGGRESLGIDAVRRMEHQVFLSSVSGKQKIFIIDPVEAMTPEASNAFLKTLEEPPASTLFLLISHRPQDLPETIRSRCQGIPFYPLPLDALAVALQERGEGEREALLLARLSGGSFGEALRIREGEKRGWRVRIAGILADCKDFDNFTLPDRMLDIIKEEGKEDGSLLERVREGVCTLCTYLLSLLRDLYVMGFPGGEERLIHSDLKKELKPLTTLSPFRLEDAMDAVIQARRKLDGNGNPEFILRVLVKDLKEILWR